MMANKDQKKPISNAYALKSDDGNKDQKKPISNAYALKSDDGNKDQKKTNIQCLCP
jgi:hypothetical protein